MKTERLGAVLALACVLTAGAQADLKQAQAEPNLEKRSKLALDNAEMSLRTIRSAYENGDKQKVEAAAAELKESVDLAYTSLTQTGKDPRRSPKWFKRAEITTRDLLRRLGSFQQDMSFSDRPMLDEVKTALQQVHDSLLMGLMEGKRK